MSNPNYCDKHKRPKVWMVSSSFCPECDKEKEAETNFGNLLDDDLFEKTKPLWEPACACHYPKPDPADITKCTICGHRLI